MPGIGIVCIFHQEAIYFHQIQRTDQSAQTTQL